MYFSNYTNFDIADNECYFDGVLGAIYSKEHTTFRLWSPPAATVTLNLYPDGDSSEPISRIPMKKKNGRWEITVGDDLDGVYYTYTVNIAGKESETIDIYARSAGVNGKRGLIFDPEQTNPDHWDRYPHVKLEKYTDAVIYELHVRDYSSDPSGKFLKRGKFISFAEKNVTNTAGDTIGLDYIASLGVTHIHLLPVFDFQTVDESSSKPQYNWGYDPMNYNIPEGSYSTDPYDGLVRVREFKELVKAIHKRGMGVIMDVVYNHTYATEDSSFNKIYPGYYYRHNQDGSFSNGSGCGNEFASERKMARKFICDSLCYLASEYKLDGFRFDLMGLIDIDTLNFCDHKLREINPNMLLYGEGWTGGGSPLDENLRAVKRNSGRIPAFAMFSDDFRDSVKGSVFHDEDQGYVNYGQNHTSERIKSDLCGCVQHYQVSHHLARTDTPCRTINYVEAHDNLTFHDKLLLSMNGASEEEIISAEKIGATLVFLSQGIPFIQAGQEFMRSKQLPEGGYSHDSYNSPDSVNGIRWDNLTEYRELSDYYKGLIAVRKAYPEFRMTDRNEIQKYMSFEDWGNGVIIANIGRFRLALNPSWQEVYIHGTGDVYVDKERASGEPLYHIDGGMMCKPRSVLLIKIG